MSGDEDDDGPIIDVKKLMKLLPALESERCPSKLKITCKASMAMDEEEEDRRQLTSFFIDLIQFENGPADLTIIFEEDDDDDCEDLIDEDLADDLITAMLKNTTCEIYGIGNSVIDLISRRNKLLKAYPELSAYIKQKCHEAAFYIPHVSDFKPRSLKDFASHMVFNLCQSNQLNNIDGLLPDDILDFLRKIEKVEKKLFKIYKTGASL